MLRGELRRQHKSDVLAEEENDMKNDDEIREIVGEAAKEAEKEYVRSIERAVGHKLDVDEEAEALYTLSAALRYANRRARAVLGFNDGMLTTRQEIALIREASRIFGEFRDEVGTAGGYAFWKELLA